MRGRTGSVAPHLLETVFGPIQQSRLEIVFAQRECCLITQQLRQIDTLHHVQRAPLLLNPRRRRGWSTYEISVGREDVFDLREPKGPDVPLLEWAVAHTPPGMEWARFMEAGVQSPCLIRVAEEPARAMRLEKGTSR